MLRKIKGLTEKIQNFFNRFYKKTVKILLGLYKTVTSVRFIVISIVAAVILFFAGWGTFSFVTSPETCLKCHEMKPEFVTWRASNHNSFSCIDCHTTEKGIKNNIKAIAVRTYRHFAGTYMQPIEIEKATKDKICLQCHSANRKVSPSGDLEFPHKTHVERGFNCIECHTGSAHGNIMEKGYTTATNYASWNIGMGQAYMQTKFTQTPMDKCMSCHKDKGVSNACETCHNSIGSPRDHQDKDWLQKHGAKARDDIWACDKCHSYSNNWIRFNEEESDFADYARNNKFCSKCHVGMEGVQKDFVVPKGQNKSKNASKRGTKITNYKPAAKAPPSHNTNWRQTHGAKASVDMNGCKVCHDEVRNPRTNSTTTFCVKCHNNHHKTTKPRFHPVEIRGFNNTCVAACHIKRYCLECHSV